MLASFTMHHFFGKTYLFILELVAFMLSFFKSITPLRDPKKILITNGAHLGDLVNATTLCYEIKKADPNIMVGVLCGSWAKDVPLNHPSVNRVHILDHWKHNRSNASFIKKIYQFIYTFWVSRREINREYYDIVIDTYCYYPNMSIPLYFTNIPIRMGFSSGGCAQLYHISHKVDVPFEHHMLDYLKELALSQLNLDLGWGGIRLSIIFQTIIWLVIMFVFTLDQIINYFHGIFKTGSLLFNI